MVECTTPTGDQETYALSITLNGQQFTNQLPFQCISPPSPTVGINWWWFVIILGGVAFLVGSIAIIWTLKRLREKKRLYVKIPDYATNGIATNIQKLQDDDMIHKIDEKFINLADGDIIGTGGQGEVRKCIYRNEKVAAKTLYGVDKNSLAGFLTEIKLLSCLHAPNIVKFIGIVIPSSKTNIWLITELMDTDLKSLLESSKLRFSQQLYIAQQIAKAMSYLHSQNPSIIHRDLKPSNVLINKNGTCKLTDFGISRLVTTVTLTANVGTFIYTAPEVWSGHYDEKIDVWSYGILLSELLTNKVPFIEEDYRDFFGFIQRLRAQELQPQIPTLQECPYESLITLVRDCTDFNPAKRKYFPDIEKVLNSL